MKRMLMIGFSLILVLSIIVACSSDGSTGSNQGEENDSGEEVNEGGENFNAEGYPIVDEAITLSMVGPRFASVGEWENLQFFEEMEEMTNINFDFNTPPDSEFDEQRNLLLASGDVPDVFFGGQFSDNELMRYGQQQGMLIPLENLIEEHAPNIQQLFEERPEIRQSITSLDGHIYALPAVLDEVMMAYPKMWVNGSWLDNLGIEELPTTTDELYDLLVRFRDEDPNQNGENDEIPMTSLQMEQEGRPLLAAFGLLERDVEEVDGEVRYNPIDPNYRNYLEYVNMLWEEGLIDSEAYSQSFEQQVAKGHQDQVGMFTAITANIILGGTEPEHRMLPVLTSDVSQEKVYPQGGGVVTGTFAITSENEHPEATMRWIDYVYSEEGSFLLSNGKEGYYWEWADDSEEMRTYVEHEDDNYFPANISPSHGIWTPLWNRAEFEASFEDPIQEQAIGLSEEKLAPYARVPYPLVQFTEEERERLNGIQGDIMTYVDTATAEFIVGQRDLAEWDDYVDTLLDLGVEEYIDIHQEAYDRWSEL